MVAAVVQPLIEEVPAGDGVLLRFNLHRGQRAALESPARFILVLAGTQSGKTAAGPLWLWHEIRRRGPGDYMVVAPTFSLMELKALPEFIALFRDRLRLGRYVTSPIRKFIFDGHGERVTFGVEQTTPTQILFGYGENPESLESSTLKGVWADEAGQKTFRRGSWEALQRRISLNTGRVLLTTTPYNLGWLKTEVYDRRDDPAADIAVINFPSTANPAFPPAELERARRELPVWKFRMFYLGLFERPAGLIYDCFDVHENIVPHFTIPETWTRYVGLDFGGVHTAAIFLAAERDAEGSETGRLFAYREYLAGGRTATEHAAALLQGEPRLPTAAGGAASEQQWRDEFGAAGLPVAAPPVTDVEVGITTVYGAITTRVLVVFDDLLGLRDEMMTYSRVLNDDGEPTEAIADKSTFHRLDALRYAMLWIRSGRKAMPVLRFSSARRVQP